MFTGDLHGVAIYTGDSSASGSAIDSLYFAKLSASSIRDVGGTVKQSSAGQFIDLSKDTAGAVTSAAKLTDGLTAGTVSFVQTNADGSNPPTTDITGASVSALISAINAAQIPGVTATFTTTGAVGVSGVAAGDTGIQISNSNGNVAISISTGIADTQTTVTQSALSANTAATPTISYVFGANGDTSVNLSGTDLLNQDDAKMALTAINQAVSAVSSQDGYLGAEINTLNSISQVMATQQENVTSAQNAVQATDYASATSNMSKYEILSQTGIAALAQANSVQQEVLKLLQ